MGKSSDVRGEHVVLRYLRRWMKLRKVYSRHLEEMWGCTGDPVFRRLHGRYPLGPTEIDEVLGLIGITRREFDFGVATNFFPELALDDIAAKNRKEVRDFGKSLRGGRPRRAYDAEDLRKMVAGLEELRFRDAGEARRQALDVLRTDDLEPDVAAEAWGVLGVLERYAGRAPITAFCLDNALRIGGSEPTRARTFQRIAMLLLFNAGNPDAALEATRRAWDCYRRCRDLAGLGKTLVDEGVILVNGTGEYHEALIAYEAALELVGDDPAHLLAALQGSAIALVHLGDLRRALRRLEQALKALSDEDSLFLLCGILWLKGEIALLLGQHCEAADQFLAVWDHYIDLEVGPLEMTLISLRIAKAYFLQGDRPRLRQVLRDMLSELGDIQRSNNLLGAALGEFLREGARGQVTAEALEDIYRRMREGTETAPPLLPTSLPVSPKKA